MFLDGTGRSVLVEDAFRDSGEYINHRIDSVFLSLLREVHDSPTVRQEFPFEKFVHQVQLHYNVDETDAFAGPVTQSVHVVTLEMKTGF